MLLACLGQTNFGVEASPRSPSTQFVWTLEFVVKVVEHGELRRYQLVLDGVTEWSVVRDVPLLWTYGELTELQVTEIDETQVFVEMVLWNDDTSLMARCTRVRVDRLP